MNLECIKFAYILRVDERSLFSFFFKKSHKICPGSSLLFRGLNLIL